MRVTVKFVNGTQAEFDGDFEHCVAFTDRYVGSKAAEVLEASGPPPEPRRRARRSGAGMREMREALKRADPRNDAQRASVIVAVADKHEQTPVDIAFVRDWFERLELRQPAQMSATVANARKDGLIASVGYGRLVPTERARALIAESSSNVVPLRRRSRMK